MGNQDERYILIASSQPSLRKGLKVFIDEENGLFVVAVVGDSHELIKKSESTHPDVILLDWDMLGRATPTLVKAISALENRSTIIVLSVDADHKSASIEAGADAFVDISEPPGKLLVAINETLKLREQM